jgi:acyl-CoA thioester hydrolase
MTPLPLPPGGCLAGPLHLYAVRAFVEDTDLLGMVYHVNYLRWFERARHDLMRLLGLDQRAAFEAGEGAFAVAQLTIRYAVPARLDDVVMIETLPDEVKAATCRISQRALRDGVLLAEAQVRVGFIGPDGRPLRQPAAWRAAFATVVNAAPIARF